jgi:hypothetical protein
MMVRQSQALDVSLLRYLDGHPPGAVAPSLANEGRSHVLLVDVFGIVDEEVCPFGQADQALIASLVPFGIGGKHQFPTPTTVHAILDAVYEGAPAGMMATVIDVNVYCPRRDERMAKV